MKLTVQQNFNSKIRITPSCWLWQACKTGSSGYGQIVINRKKFYAHRIAYELYNGPIPAGLNILHKCDNPICVNPDHLRVGTQLENVQDMIAKNRNVKGSLSPAAKLNEADVRTIREDKRRNVEIAVAFGVSQQSICDIRKGRSWSHVN